MKEELSDTEKPGEEEVGAKRSISHKWLQTDQYFYVLMT